MRTYILLVLFLPALVKAQYCGNSGPAVCTPVYFAPDTGKIADSEFDSLPCVVRGVPYNESISFRTDSLCFVFGAQFACFDLNSFEVDSLWGLPNGICWATNEVDNKVTTGQWLCLNFSGTTNAIPGAYTVRAFTYSSVPFPTQPIEGPALTFYLRVIEPGAPCQATVIYNDVSETEPTLPELKLVGEKLLATNIQPGSAISIYDLTGRLLKQQTAQQAAEINLADIQGMFMVSVLNRGNRYTQKFVR